MRIISAVLLSLMLIAEGADAISNEDKEKLAEMFSPILILTEETRNVYDDETVPIRVLKPEPVSIIGANSTSNIWVSAKRVNEERVGEGLPGSYQPAIDLDDFEIQDECSNVDFSENRFAFLTSDCRMSFSGIPPGSGIPSVLVVYPDHFDYPGDTATEWNNTYFGTGSYAGENHSNTAYVHIDSTTHSNYSGKLYVIQYHYFYPYNDWWNNHEGDWQRIDVVVSSSDPDDNTIEVIGVEYRFHGAWVTYYKNFSNHAGLTSSFDFNPRENLKLSQGTHPVVYVGAGSHAAFPVGGLIRLHNIANTAEWEYMTHIGLVLSTQADNSHGDLWESYNLVLLPDPDPDNTNNMGLDPDMSWLGVQIRWGTPTVDSPELSKVRGGHKSPGNGPYNSEADCFSLETIPPNCGWGELKFDEVGDVSGEPFPHDDLPYDSYHHWAIIGNETWSGSISLTGDVVVFPGATLTIEPGTVIEFVTSDNDRHEFSLGNGTYYQTEIFVYGALTTESPLPIAGTAADSILFQRNDPDGSGEAWGGIHVMAGGTATLNSYTRISDTRRGKPTNLTAEPVDGQIGHIELTWTNPNDSSIPQWEYQQKAGSADWGPWMPIPGSTSSTTSHIVEGLTIGVSYQFKVRGLNRTDLAESDPSAAVTAAGPPDPPELTVAAGHEKVRMRWSPGANNGSEITGHKWRYKAGAANWNPNQTVYGTGEQIIRNLDNDTTYTFQMKSKNGVGYSEVVEVTATPRNPIAGPTAISFAENSDAPVASYRFAPAELDQSLVDYRLHLSDVSGFDSGLFELNSGELRFQNAPDFETPADADGNNLYTVRLRAAPVSGNGGSTPRTEPPLPFTKQVEVTVENADDPGVIELSPLSPQVGVPFTAELTDQDGGITGASWQWQGQEPGTTTWQTLSGTSASGSSSSSSGSSSSSSPSSSLPYPELSSYTPQVAQVGWALRAVVNPYSDVFGAGKRTESDPTVPVQAGVPSTPENLTAAEGDQSVTLTWETPTSDGGSPITGYTYRYRAGAPWQPSADGTTLTATTFYIRDTISSLTNDTVYTFEVWANNAQGKGVVAEGTATPRGPFTLTATARDAYVFLHWTAAPSRGAPIDRYKYRRSSDGGTTWSGWQSVWFRQWHADDPLSYTVTGLTNDQRYEFEVTAHDSAGEVAVASAASMPGAATADVQVAYSAEAYQAQEGGAAVSVEVRLTHSARQAVSIPVTVTRDAGTESGDYAVDWNGHTANSLSFAAGDRSQSFTITAYEDADSADETVTVGLTVADPPSWLGVGTPTTATATLRDNDDTSPLFSPSGISKSATVGQYFSFTRPAASGGNAPLTYSVSSTCSDDLPATSSSVSGSPSSTGQCGISWTVTDTDGDTDTYSLQISVGSASDPMPLFSPSGISKSAIAGQYFSFTRPAASGGNTPLTYSVSGSCAGLTATSSSVSGSPRFAGPCGFTWTVTDADDDTDTYALQITVDDDTSPVFSSSDASRSAIVGQYFSFTRPAASGGNAPLSYSVSGSCAGLTATSSSVSGQPSSTGQCGFTWTVTDHDGDTDTYALQVSVRSASDPMPSFASSGTSRSATVGQYFSFTRPAASGGNAPLTYSVSGSCAGLTANSSSVSGQPSSTGQCGFTWTVRDNDGDTDTYSLQISVGSASDPMPSFASSGTSRSATVGQYFSFSRPAASGGNAPLSYSVSGSCAGLTANSSSVSGQPSSTGQCGFTWTVRDNDGDTDTYSLQISVGSASDPMPSFASSGTSRSATVGQYFSFTRPAASGGNTPLSYSVSGSCAGLTATSSSVSGSPSSTGQCGFTWTVRDNDGDTDTYSLQISVGSASDPMPSFASSGTSRSATVGQYFSFSRPSASGGNAPLSYSVSGSCAGLTANSSSVSGSPSSTGQCGFTWTVSDNDGDTDTYSLQISVSAADTSPSFASSGTSRSATVGQYFSFSRPSASGGNAPLSYSVSGSCAGLTATSSSVSGSPSSTGQCGFTWTVTDHDGDTDTYSLQVSVSAADTSPSFASSGTSRSATVGQYFSFSRPSASGGNAPLSYSVSGSCAGLTANSSSVSGAPSSTGQCGFTWTVTDHDGDTDTYSLQISVSARTASADTAPVFSGSGTSEAIIAGVFSSLSLPSVHSGNAPLRYSTRGLPSSLFQAGLEVRGIPSETGQFAVT